MTCQSHEQHWALALLTHAWYKMDYPSKRTYNNTHETKQEFDRPRVEGMCVFFKFIYFVYTYFFTTHLNDKCYFNFIINNFKKALWERREKHNSTRLSYPSIILKTTCSFQLPFAFARPHIFTMKVLCCIKSHKLSL